jgi:hypothetical protein
MPTAIYDASIITFRKRAGTLAAFNSNLVALQNQQTLIVRREQPTSQSAEVILTRKQGACICADNNNGVNFNNQTQGPCGCR